ncbi:MAG: hypothetical protein JRM80_00750 [Nitrososphaerota archaeon]|nr:hypothetical protein [Nitrososphaerota archaeon]MDG6973541.1 hypothetical protein [Nitrososphaerota archaeon]MDG6987555.1 hypothetical protein [Nitrososphaerota archaeon]MDG7014954.1 hypothetical protein [Nitrososphaerota archaeon]WGO50912.1 MAG: hypothetical protein JRM93_02540 [Nitrososphaerota archaeon]
MAGFSITFITIIVSTSFANTVLVSPVRWGDIAILLFGLASVGFITATEFFLGARNYNLWELPGDYRKALEDAEGQKQWKVILDDSTRMARRNEQYARKSYNSAIFLLFAGLFFVIGPYNLVVAFIVAGTGTVLEVLQALGLGSSRQKS